MSNSLYISNGQRADVSYLSTLRAAFAALPSKNDMAKLISDADIAEVRGYYDPIEDERLQDTYTRYLAIRVSLWQIIQDLGQASKRIQKGHGKGSDEDLAEFGIAFSAAEIIVRTGEHLIDLARTRRLVWRKLDEASLTYGLPRKSFTRLYRQLTSAFQMHGFYKACKFYDDHKTRILDVSSPLIGDILETLNLPTASRGDHIKRYRRFMRHSLKRRQKSVWKNILFSIFEMAGSDIADLKVPFLKPLNAPKRVTCDVIRDLKSHLQPGDVFVTRHDDAMSNVFLPGFWPHSALWIGEHDTDILEAKKDGVLYRNVDETLQVDAFTVLRPKLAPADIQTALGRARDHVGKLYDFVFDFRTSDRLVCTEVIYRAYHGIGEIKFNLTKQAGRHCLSAENLINQGVGNDWFDVVAVYGINGNDLITGPDAFEKLRASFASEY